MSVGWGVFVIPKLATVFIDTEKENGEPLLKIVLDETYRGDLNDLVTEGSDGVYLQCDSTTAIDNPALAKFMEVLHHWDYDGDGRYDGDTVVWAIEEALYRSTEAPDRFHRPSGGPYTNLLMRLMPPQPDRPIVFGYGELKKRFKLRHYLLTVPTILAIMGLIQLQVWLIPWTQYSVVSGFMALAAKANIAWWLAIAVFIILYEVMSKHRRDVSPTQSKHTYGFFSKAAVYEEQAFREGSERWNWHQRTMSCVVFGAIHMVNLIYPLATILPLALGGAVFMWVYLRDFAATNSRRSAVLAAAVVHRVYNRLALIALGLWLVLTLGTAVIGIFTFVGVLLLTVMVSNWNVAADKLCTPSMKREAV